jgi:hypothetical protein
LLEARALLLGSLFFLLPPVILDFGRKPGSHALVITLSPLLRGWREPNIGYVERWWRPSWIW